MFVFFLNLTSDHPFSHFPKDEYDDTYDDLAKVGDLDADESDDDIMKTGNPNHKYDEVNSFFAHA